MPIKQRFSRILSRKSQSSESPPSAHQSQSLPESATDPTTAAQESSRATREQQAEVPGSAGRDGTAPGRDTPTTLNSSSNESRKSKRDSTATTAASSETSGKVSSNLSRSLPWRRRKTVTPKEQQVSYDTGTAEPAPAKEKSEKSDADSGRKSRWFLGVRNNRDSRNKQTSDQRQQQQKEPKDGRQQQQQRRRHPSERPLTEMNLRHQEMLSHFKMEFGRGRRRPSLGGRSSFSGISPRTSWRPGAENEM
ncbi:hypothetical protein VTK73DRAFT_2602 [Phialemonium thermophilum]|uniref:Uncharacterized protein n=1 Tax=Phialemonium thermophilum TaxID=223376 RepID=A0ABR3X3L9_9PEZI